MQYSDKFFLKMSQTQSNWKRVGLKSFWLKSHKNVSTLQFTKSWCGFNARSILHYLLCLLHPSGFFSTTKTICQLTHGFFFIVLFLCYNDNWRFRNMNCHRKKTKQLFFCSLSSRHLRYEYFFLLLMMTTFI